MELKSLINGLEIITTLGSEAKNISTVTPDSRKLESGSLFVCIRGFNSDGHKYIASAIDANAGAIVVDSIWAKSPEADELTSRIEGCGITLITVEDTRKALAIISANYFGNPAKQMTMIGLTGTKGKTTTAHMIKGMLEECGNKVGMIGTIGAFIGSEKIPTNNTTPESFELHSLFRKMLDAGCSYVVMEVSSQALKLDRTYGIDFDYVAFLNLSPDHIGDNEHKDFEEYKYCKSLLFSQGKCAVANIDAEHWQDVTKVASDAHILKTVSAKGDADLSATNIENVWTEDLFGVSFNVNLFSEKVYLGIPGIFNVENALIALEICIGIGLDKIKMLEGLKKVHVRGRTELVKSAAPITTMIIDYAHNAISTVNLLQMLKSYNPGRLIVVFGGGGNKPKARRYDMGEAAGHYADLTIITTDNPRFEELDVINSHIIEGLNVWGGKYEIIPDRTEAIHYLIDNARKDDIIALIGKGHEEYQDIKGVKYHFSEIEVINEYMAKKLVNTPL